MYFLRKNIQSTEIRKDLAVSQTIIKKVTDVYELPTLLRADIHSHKNNKHVLFISDIIL